jgi:tetratricopeptide (TPR) repeat protein
MSATSDAANAGASGSAAPLKGFVSYAHEDEPHRATLAAHLSALEREGLVDIWHDRKITGGREWAGAIDAALKEAQIVLLLISADFLDSDYCNDVELAEAIRMHETGRARVVPVILRSCDWQHSKFARFNALPPDGLPVTELEHPDQGFTAVARGVRAIVGELRAVAVGNSPDVGASVVPSSPDVQPQSPAGTPPKAGKRPRLTIGKISFLGIEFGPIELPLPAHVSLKWGLAVLLVLALAGVGSYLLVVRGPLEDARTAMRMARYDKALEALGELPSWVAWWPHLGHLRAKARLGVGFNAPNRDREALAAELGRQRRAWPGDADLMVLAATYWLGREDYDKARALLEEALRADKENAEAWFLSGLDRDLHGDRAAAAEDYRQAAALAPDSPQYRGNLARALLDSGQVDSAIEEYGRIPGYPLGRVEQALGHWARGQWREAKEAQRDALKMLDTTGQLNFYFHRRAWVFTLSDKGVRLGAVEDKRCYARLGEAASRALAGEGDVPFPPRECSDPPLEIAQLVAYDLCRFVDAYKPEFSVTAAGLRRALKQDAQCPAPATAAPAAGMS